MILICEERKVEISGLGCLLCSGVRMLFGFQLFTMFIMIVVIGFVYVSDPDNRNLGTIADKESTLEEYRTKRSLRGPMMPIVSSK